MPKISIIVPVYNAEKYIKHCIESILKQTYTDFELLLINDGSSDNSGLICDEYAQIDSRIKVFHQKNNGVSSARNLGLKKAKGAYITFSDSDDLLVDTAFQTYIDAFSYDDSVDIVKTGYYQEFENGNPTNIFSSKQDIVLRNRTEYLSYLTFDPSNYNGFLWNECLRKEIVGSHKFEESLNWCEDHIFSFTCFYDAKSIYISRSLTYRYQVRRNISLSNTTDIFLKIKAIGILYKTRKKLLESNNYIIEERMNKAYQGGILFILDNLDRTKYKYNKRKLIRREIAHKEILIQRDLFFFYYHLPLWAGELILHARRLVLTMKNKLSL